jgi:hypothetical protein
MLQLSIKFMFSSTIKRQEGVGVGVGVGGGEGR